MVITRPCGRHRRPQKPRWIKLSLAAVLVVELMWVAVLVIGCQALFF